MVREWMVVKMKEDRAGMHRLVTVGNSRRAIAIGEVVPTVERDSFLLSSAP
jgi:hypothetical protein